MLYILFCVIKISVDVDSASAKYEETYEHFFKTSNLIYLIFLILTMSEVKYEIDKPQQVCIHLLPDSSS